MPAADEKKSEQKPAEKPKTPMEQLQEKVKYHQDTVATNTGDRNYQPLALSNYEDKSLPFQVLKEELKKKLAAVGLDNIHVNPLTAADPAGPPPPTYTMTELVNIFCDNNVNALLRSIHEASLTGNPVDLSSPEWTQKFAQLKVEFNETVLGQTDVVTQAEATLAAARGAQDDLLSTLQQARDYLHDEHKLEMKQPLDPLITASQSLGQSLGQKQQAADRAKDEIRPAETRLASEQHLRGLPLLLKDLAQKELIPNPDAKAHDAIMKLHADVDEFKKGFAARPVLGPVRAADAQNMAVLPEAPPQYQLEFKASFDRIEELSGAVRVARAELDKSLSDPLATAQTEAAQVVLTQELRSLIATQEQKPGQPAPAALPLDLKGLMTRAQAELATELRQFPNPERKPDEDPLKKLDEIKALAPDKQLEALVGYARSLDDPKAERVQNLAELAQLGQAIDKDLDARKPETTVTADFMRNWEQLQQQALRQFEGQVSSHLKQLEDTVASKKKAFVDAQEGRIQEQGAFQTKLVEQAGSALEQLREKLGELERPAGPGLPPAPLPEAKNEIATLKDQISKIETALTAVKTSNQPLTEVENKKKKLNEILDNEFIEQLKKKVADEQYLKNVENLKRQEEAQYCNAVRQLWAQKVGWDMEKSPFIPIGYKPGLPTGQNIMSLGAQEVTKNKAGMSYKRNESSTTIDFYEKDGQFTISASGGNFDEQAKEMVHFALSNGIDKLSPTDINIFNQSGSQKDTLLFRPYSDQGMVFEATMAKFKAVLDTQYNFYKLDDVSKMTVKDLEKYKNSYLISETDEKKFELYYVTDKGVKQKLNIPPEELGGQFKAMGLNLGKKNLEAVEVMKLESGEVPQRVKSLAPQQINALNELIKQSGGISINKATDRMYTQAAIQINKDQILSDLQYMSQNGYIGGSSWWKDAYNHGQLSKLTDYLAVMESKAPVEPKKQLAEGQQKSQVLADSKPAAPAVPNAPPVPGAPGVLSAVNASAAPGVLSAANAPAAPGVLSAQVASPRAPVAPQSPTSSAPSAPSFSVSAGPDAKPDPALTATTLSSARVPERKEAERGREAKEAQSPSSINIAVEDGEPDSSPPSSPRGP